ncbi:hypothetical protein QFC21_005717 [Naganishia friedmannii]|uniref:Uncharacterized protein n=1 Tax=Naganishia friedmannii TaxID=89922 RepID=A0ACC2V723_9TREE|nr:hypothetical protein QFC21_005717 [Naganishia friedmannii]
MDNTERSLWDEEPPAFSHKYEEPQTEFKDVKEVYSRVSREQLHSLEYRSQAAKDDGGAASQAWQLELLFCSTVKKEHEPELVKIWEKVVSKFGNDSRVKEQAWYRVRQGKIEHRPGATYGALNNELLETVQIMYT